MNKELQHHLIRNNEQETLALLENGANISELEQYVLRWAIDMDKPEWIRKSLQAGADIDYTDEDFVQSVYMDLIDEGQASYVKILIECGWDIIHRSYSLQSAALRGHMELVVLLVDYGADMFEEKSQALNLAAQRDRFDVVGFFLNHKVPTQWIEYEKVSKQMKIFIQQYIAKQNLHSNLSHHLQHNPELPSSKI